MPDLHERVKLRRMAHEPACVGMVSLPLPGGESGRLRLDHDHSGLQPLAWRAPGRAPRRSLACVVDEGGVPEHLALTTRPPLSTTPSTAWGFTTHVTREKLSFTPHAFSKIAELRGVPVEECTCVEGELLLTYGGRTLAMQCGATGPRGGPYWWQNVQIDSLWANPVAQAIRVGGVIYNGDTYLWGDVFLILFSNGVAQLAAHFVNTRLHIEGYDFQGLPVIRLRLPAGFPVPAMETRVLPDAGMEFELPGCRLNLGDSQSVCSREHPGQLEITPADVRWWPVDRTFNPQLPGAAPVEWARGFARTFRCHLSLGSAPARVARYSVPGWWYTECGELWADRLLPTRGRFQPIADATLEANRHSMVSGRFDAGNADFGNDGDLGWGLMHHYYLSGRPELFQSALTYCTYWADLAVDHTDYTVHQWVGGWGWKTCAYTKFRDVLFAYLETGDPQFRDTVEMVADTYWSWFRSNWPRNTLGRDNFEVGACAWLWRYLGTEQARMRVEEFCRMIRTVLQTRGMVGGQMGAGPHPGFHASLYMTMVTLVSLMEVAEVALELAPDFDWESLRWMIQTLHTHLLRDDIEMFPSNYGQHRHQWNAGNHGMWAMAATRLYAEAPRFGWMTAEAGAAGLKAIRRNARYLPLFPWPMPRGVMGYFGPTATDAMITGARWKDNGLLLEPVWDASQWPQTQEIDTPQGPVTVRLEGAGASHTLRFESAARIPILVKWMGRSWQAHSPGSCPLQ